MGYRDVAPSGLTVVGTALEDRVMPPCVQFGSDAPIVVPTCVRNLRLARLAEVCAFKGQDDDRAYTVTRSGIVTRHGAVAGDQAVALSPSGLLAYVIDPGQSRPPTEYMCNGVARPIPARLIGTTQGIHAVDDDGTVVWGDDRLVPATFGPLTLIKWTTEGAWTWGTTPWGCGVWNAITQRAYVAVRDAEMLWTMRGAVVNGDLVLARSLPAVEIHERQFTEWTPEVAYAPLVDIGRALWMFWFYGTGVEPSNCAFVDPTFTGHTFIAGPNWRYVSGASDGNVADIHAAIERARPEGKAILAYVPRAAQHALPMPCDVQGVEAYLGKDETDDAFLKRIGASLAKCARAVLFPQVYTSNTNHTTELRRLPGLICRLAIDYPQVEGVGGFSGAGRGTGWGDHPEVRADWQQVFDSITGTPVVLPPLPPEPPDEHNTDTDPPAPPVVKEPPPMPAPAPEPVPPTMEQPPYVPPVPTRPASGRKPNVKKAILDVIRALWKFNFRKAFGRTKPKPQLPLPSPDVPVEPMPPVVDTPTPVTYPVAPRLPVRASFCSHRDHRGRVVFDPQHFPFLWWRWVTLGDEVARDDFYATLDQKRRHGVTHVVCDPPDGSIYEGDWMPSLPNWMSGEGLDHFCLMVHAVIARGMVPIIYCFGGGQQDAPAIYDGRLRALCARFHAEGFVPRAIFLWAWESYGRDPECTAKQNSDAWEVMWEALGATPDALIAGHVGSREPERSTWASWPVEPDDPTQGDEIGAWYTAGGRRLSLHFGQLTMAGTGPQGGWEARRIEILDRFLPALTPMPGIGHGTLQRDPDQAGRIDRRPYAIGPDWFGGSRALGRVEFVDWEPGIPWGYIRHGVTDDTVRHIYAQQQTLGVQSFGCMPVGE